MSLADAVACTLLWALCTFIVALVAYAGMTEHKGR